MMSLHKKRAKASWEVKAYYVRLSLIKHIKEIISIGDIIDCEVDPLTKCVSPFFLLSPKSYGIIE